MEQRKAQTRPPRRLLRICVTLGAELVESLDRLADEETGRTLYRGRVGRSEMTRQLLLEALQARGAAK